MLNLIIGAPSYGQYDFGIDIDIQIYQQDKATVHDLTGSSGVVQIFKRYGDDNFLPFKDVARAIRLTGNMAQVVSDIPITIPSGTDGKATFQFTATLRPSLFGRFWMKILLNGDTAPQSTRFVSFYVHPGAPQ